MVNQSMKNYQQEKKQIIKVTRRLYFLGMLGVIVSLFPVISNYTANNKVQSVFSILASFIFVSFIYIFKRIKEIRLKEISQREEDKPQQKISEEF
jgi:uncharacterized membrane protein